MKTKTETITQSITAYRLDDQIGYLLRRAYQRASMNTSRTMEKFGVTPLQYATLARLQESGEISQNQLGRLVDMEPGNFHGVIRRLVGRGLVQCCQDNGDKRKVSLKLTSCGYRLVEDLMPMSIKSTEMTLAGLTAAQRDKLYELLQLIVDTKVGKENSG